MSELCGDWYQENLGSSPVVDPFGKWESRDLSDRFPRPKDVIVLRGGHSPVYPKRGSKELNTFRLRSAHREIFGSSSGGGDHNAGLRLVIPFEFFSGEVK